MGPGGEAVFPGKGGEWCHLPGSYWGLLKWTRPDPGKGTTALALGWEPTACLWAVPVAGLSSQELCFRARQAGTPTVWCQQAPFPSLGAPVHLSPSLH